MAGKIVAVDDNEINLKVVSTTLEQAGYEVTTATNGAEALPLISKMLPDVVILDISMPIMDGYEVCSKIRENKKTSHIPVMMLTAHNALDDKIKGFDAGADDYLTKPFQPAELQARIAVLVRRSSQRTTKIDTSVEKHAKTISVFSLRGGVGVSAMAANIAAGISKVWGKNVALVDLSLAAGQAALLLNMSLRNTWLDLAHIPPDDLDKDVVDAVMLKSENGVHVLAAPRKVADGQLITPAAAGKVIEIIKEMYDYVVLDLASDFSDLTLQGLDQSDMILAVLSPELASVRATIAALDVFSDLGYKENKDIVLVLNRTFEGGILPRKNIEKALKQPIQIFIPYASQAFVDSINFGVPIVLSEEGGELVGIFEDIGFLLSKDVDRAAPPKEPTPAYRSVMSRFEQRNQRR
jgi:CheY-like chemotaxis protein/MinD-like ATPase involved in chromosome partitioning or flagellar assembly